MWCLSTVYLLFLTVDVVLYIALSKDSQLGTLSYQGICWEYEIIFRADSKKEPYHSLCLFFLEWWNSRLLVNNLAFLPSKYTTFMTLFGTMRYFLTTTLNNHNKSNQKSICVNLTYNISSVYGNQKSKFFR